MKKTNYEIILGTKICTSPQKKILDTVIRRVENGRQTVIFTPNPQILLKARKSKKYGKILNSSTLNLPDGIGIVIASKLCRSKIKERVGGIDFANSLIRFAEKEGYKIFLLGAKPSVAENAKRNLKKAHPSLLICGTHHGYFKKSGEENDIVIEKIKNSSPDILFVCLGAPAQEEWITKNKDRLPSVKLFIGLGGSLDVFAGNARRAPKFIQIIGLEWLYRTIKEPRRARIFWDIPVFLFEILKSKKGSRSCESLIFFKY